MNPTGHPPPATPHPTRNDVGVVVVVTGGAPLDPAAVADLPDDAIFVCADGGLDWAKAAGLVPNVLVGDLDSVSAEGLAWADAHAVVVRHPVDKSATDTELAIDHALSLGSRRLVLIAGPGDRLDHTVAAIGALGSPSLDHLDSVESWWGADRLYVATPRRPVRLDAPSGTTFSALAMHGPCRGVDITGARWPLAGADLDPLVGVGVSNQVLDAPVGVTIRAGVLTVIVPGAQPCRATHV